MDSQRLQHGSGVLLRKLAIAAGTCAAAWLLYKQLRSKDRLKLVAEQPGAEPRTVADGTPLTILPESVESADGLPLKILPETVGSISSQRTKNSGLRAFCEQAVTSRILRALPLYVVASPLLLGLTKGPGFISFASGLSIGMAFPAMLWPTDEGVQSRSWFRVQTPLSLMRAILVSRTVLNEWVHNAHTAVFTSYIHAPYCIFMTWSLVVLNVRARAPSDVDLPSPP